MFETLKNAWKIADLRKKLLYTLLIVVIFRIGCKIPVPYIDPAAIKGLFAGGNLLGYMSILTGGALENATIFAMGISPYITSSIVVQLLAIAIPALERLSKEGEAGRKKLNQITRYVTIVLALVQAFALYLTMKANNALVDTSWFVGAVIVLTLTAGAMVVTWLGERIDQKGIGNGISMILFAGILAGGPQVVTLFWNIIVGGSLLQRIMLPVIVILFILIIAFIVVMTNAERRIPVQYAKRVVGRKMYGGNSSNIPLKVNMSGVMPIIFASSLMAIPGTIGAFISNPTPFWKGFFDLFSYTNWLYAVLFFILIVAFNYFYVAIQYNPVEIANNLRQNSGGIPGIRPGKPTSDFITKILGKITLMGGLFLGIMAILPIAVGAITNIPIALGGTTVMIIVGVALDTVRDLESQMMMRHYKGFLE